MKRTAALRSFPAQVWIVSIATFLNRSVGFLALFSAIFFKSLELNAAAISLALFVVGFAGVLGSLVGGWTAARFGPIAVLMAGSVLNVPVLVLLGTFEGSPLVPVAAAALSVGLSQSFVSPSAVLVTESDYAGDTVTVFAFYRIFINVGSVVAPALAGIFGLGNFRLLFILSAIGSAAVVVLLLLTRHRLTTRRKTPANADASSGESKESRPAEYFATFRVARLWAIVVVFGITIAIYAQHQSGVPLSVDRLNQGARLYALLLFINPIIIIFFELPLSFVIAKIKWSVAFGVGVFLTALGLAITGLGNSWLVCIIGFTIFSIGEAVFAPLANSSIAKMTYPGENARYQGYLSAAQSVGISIGPGIGAFGVLNNRGLFWIGVVLVGVVLCAVSMLAGRKARMPQETEKVASYAG